MIASEFDYLKVLALLTPVLVVAMALFVVWLTGLINAREDRRRAQEDARRR